MKCLDQAGGDSSQCQGFWDALKVNILLINFFSKLFVSSKGMSTLSRR